MPILLKDARGFSLLEIIAVLAIIGIVGAITLPSMFNTDRYQATSIVRKIALDLELARERAIDEQKRIQVYWRDASTWYIEENLSGELPDYLLLEKGGNIVFFANGSSSGGQLLLRHQEQIWRINVGKIVGIIKVEVLDD